MVTVKPMLAHKIIEHTPPTGPGWLFERKFDGVRAVAGLRAGHPFITSREGADLTEKFPEVAAILKRLPWSDTTLDGELVGDGLSAMQWRVGLAGAGEFAIRRCPATLHAFDLLAGQGQEFVAAPLSARKELLEALLRRQEGVVEVVACRDGAALWSQALAEGWEGIVAKRADSLYRPGRRSDSWVKVKPGRRA